MTEPAFEYAAFGAAEMMSGPVLIDGDLSDWGPLRHPLRMGFRGQGTDRIQDGPEVYMRWSPRGLYFAARIKDDGGIQPCPDKVFVGDALEVWIDTLNSRRRLMREVPSSHQLFFTPFGFRGDPQATFAEWGRGARGLQLDRTYPDAARERGWSAARTEAGGYTIERFLKREALAEPRLLPGHYLAVNFSVNLGNWNQYQWSASKAVGTWDKPFTWGDVLLLGTDAEVAARPLVDAPSGRAAAALGEAIAVEVRDPDMNGHPGRTDRATARAAVPGTGEQLVLILKETGLDSGVFTGSFHTAPVFEEVERHALRVRSGDLLMLTYVDAHRAFGERNQSLNTSYPIGWPVMRLATCGERTMKKKSPLQRYLSRFLLLAAALLACGLMGLNAADQETSAGESGAVAEAGEESITSTLTSPFMLPIYLCSVLLVAAIIERAIRLRRDRVLDPDELEGWAALIRRGEVRKAREQAQASRTVVGQAWARGWRTWWRTATTWRRPCSTPASSGFDRCSGGCS